MTNDGTDSASCGNSATPCRSISQAIENASAGDTIEVGAGVYGDISGDGTFTHAGDERPQLLPSFPSFIHRIAGCIVCFTKPLHIFSLRGASVTNIVGIPSGVPSANYPTTVQIVSPGVTFRDTGSGFTVTGGNGTGIVLKNNLASGGTGTGFDLAAGFQTELGGTAHGTDTVSLTDNDFGPSLRWNPAIAARLRF